MTAIVFPDQLGRVIRELQEARLEWRAAHARNVERGVHFPAREALERITRELGVALFPLRLGPRELTPGNENAYVAATLESTLSQLGAQIDLELRYADPGADGAATARQAAEIVGAFAAALPTIRRALDADVAAGYASDPAARSVDEVLIAYPSLTAIIHHRLAHALHTLGAPIVARLIATIAQVRTGIDIHPGATIGRAFSIDHGVGVVIGETTVIGDRVRLHQGVTLGGDPAAVGSDAGRQAARHPIIGDDVVIHANASVIGRVRIGDRTRIGGNVWLTRDVPADRIVELPAPVARRTASGLTAAPATATGQD